MVKRTIARVVSALGLFLGLAGLLVLIPSLAVSDTFVSGLNAPTGLAIHPNERSLYVKSGISGTVWKVPILSDGKAGSVTVVTDQFQPVGDIEFDAAGNLYGVLTDAGLNDLWQVDTFGEVCAADLYNEITDATGIAIETPGLSSSRLFFIFTESGPKLAFTLLSSFQCGKRFYSDDYDRIANSCGFFRFLLYRPSLADLVGSWGNTVSSVNINDASCTTLVSNLAQPNGLAEDDEGNLYVADAGTGEIVKRTTLGQIEVIAEGLSSPTGLAFDSATGLLFVSETDADQIITINPAETNNPPNIPSNPTPTDGATGVSVTPTLSWSGGDPDPGDTVTYDVYFGTSSSPPLVVGGQTATSYSPGTLSFSTTYYWKVVARDSHGAETTGPAWSFTTQASPCTNNQSPLAIAQADPTSGSAPLTVQFDGDDSLDADGSIVAYLWTFGDGQVSTEPNPVHTYTSPGIYTATLVVTDDCGAVDSDEVSIFICPVATALEEDPNKETKLELLRQFRDEVLGSSPEGEHYVQLFYDHAVEVSWLLLRHPELRSQSQVLIDRFLPVVQTVLAGEQAVVREAELEGVEALLGAFAAYGSAELRADIQALQVELRKGGVLEQFGIVVR